MVKPFGIESGFARRRRQERTLPPALRSARARGLATGAEMVTSRFFYALGYHVPENYIVRFERPQLVADAERAGGLERRASARARRRRHRFVPSATCPSGPGRTYRAVATRLPEGPGALLGPYQVWGTRRDDPNDIVPHEHRRDLRGLFVFAAWLNNSNTRAVGTQDILDERRRRHAGSATT